ncbi:MAG: hypothetical protein ACTSQA_00245 [Candidatus Heimdallarchaeaceae archaeon]
MAVVSGVNAGFVTEAPVADPVDANRTMGGTSNSQFLGVKHNTPAGTTKISEMGVWIDNSTNDMNIDLGIYTHNSGDDRPGTLIGHGLFAKGTGTGWKTVAVDIEVDAETTYWVCSLGNQSNAITTTNGDTDAGPRAINFATSLTELPASLASGSSFSNFAYAIYATAEGEPTGFTRKIKISGTFQDKPIKTKVAGVFVDKPIKIKVDGDFQ